MTEDTDTTRTDPAPRTMGEISHTNPYTGETAGHLFRRGPVVAADGGREPVDDGTAADSDDARSDGAGRNGRTMKDVSHTPPNGSEDANRVFERGRQSAEDAEE